MPEIDPHVVIQDRRRGHKFTPPKNILHCIPKLYATEGQTFEDKVIYVHYFVGACDWYIAELDQENWLAFGYANLGDPMNAEWGYIDLNELGSLDANYIGVERDLYWEPRPFAEAIRGIA